MINKLFKGNIIVLNLCLVFIFFNLTGCVSDPSLSRTYKGSVIDSETGIPIKNAIVNGNWIFHDNPLPDGSGHDYVYGKTVTDNNGRFELEKVNRRGGFFGTEFSLNITAPGYIDAVMIADPKKIPLPESTITWPFITTTTHVFLPSDILISLKPGRKIYLEELKSPIVLRRSLAAEKIGKMGAKASYALNELIYALDDEKIEVRCAVAKTLGKIGADAKAAVPAMCKVLKSSPDDSILQDNLIKSLKLIGGTLDTQTEKFIKAEKKRKKEKRKKRKKQKYYKKITIDEKTDIHWRHKRSGATLLMQESRRGHLDNVKKLLDKGVDVNDKDKYGTTSLSLAAKNGHEEIVELLLRKGADVNVKNNAGHTSLQMSARQGHTEIITLLLKNGALLHRHEKYGCVALGMAADSGQIKVLIKLLPVNNNQFARGELMRMSALHGHSRTVEFFLKIGVDINDKSKMGGRTALMMAAREGHLETVKLLIKNGAAVNATSEKNRTALMLVAMRGHIEVVKYLLVQGADVSIKDNWNGSTALSYAMKNGHTSLIPLLGDSKK
jgi:ankyrin repeat protein